MDRLNLIQDKAQKVIGTYRGPVFLIDVAAGLFLAMYLMLLTAERALVNKGQRQNFEDEAGRAGNFEIMQGTYIGSARKLVSYFTLAWLLGVAAYGSAWTRDINAKIYPIFGFFCAIAIEGFEIHQRAEAWDPWLYLRNVFTFLALSILVVYRQYRSADDWRLLLVPFLAALPLLSFVLWPRQQSMQTRPVPYPDSAVLLPSAFVTAWILATMNHGVPAFIQGIRAKVFQGSMVALAAGVAVFFAKLTGSIIAWFFKFQGSVSMAPYATYAFTGFVVTTLFASAMSIQTAGVKRTVLFMPLFVISAFAASIFLHKPSHFQVSTNEGFDNLTDSEDIIVRALAEGINQNLELTKNDAARKLDLEHLRLAYVSKGIVPDFVRRNITHLHLPWMTVGAVGESGSIGNLAVEPLSWLEVRTNLNLDADLRQERVANAQIFLDEGPYQKGIAATRAQFRALQTQQMFSTIHDTPDPTNGSNNFQILLAYSGPLQNLREYIGHLVYLSRRIQYWRLLISAYLTALRTSEEGRIASTPETSGVRFDPDRLDRLLQSAQPTAMADLQNLTALFGTEVVELPMMHIAGSTTSAAKNRVLDSLMTDPWLATFERLQPGFDATSSMSISSRYGQTIYSKVDLSPFVSTEGVVVAPDAWRTLPPGLDDPLFAHGPKSDGQHPHALYFMLLFLHSDAFAWNTHLKQFWSLLPQPPTEVARDLEAHKVLVKWASALSNPTLDAASALADVPIYKTLLQNVFHWTPYKDDGGRITYFVDGPAARLLYDLVVIGRREPQTDQWERVVARVATELLDASKSPDVRAIGTLLAMDDAAAAPWKGLREWAREAVDLTTGLSLFLYVASAKPSWYHDSRSYDLPREERATAVQSEVDDVLYPLQDITEPTREALVNWLWNADPPAAPVIPQQITKDLSFMARYDNFGKAAVLQLLHNFSWLPGIVAILGLSFKYELHVLHVGLFGNYEGIGLYQQYVYGAIFVALAAGLLQLLHLGRLEALKNYVVTNMGSTRQTFPAIVFYASSVLYMVPGLVHQITSQKIRTLYFLALFFVFLFFAPVRPFLPLSEELRQKWSLAGERWANRINAVASGAVLLLLVIMVGFGFFDPNRPWPKALQILVSVLLLICAMLASPLYVVMKDVREDRTDAHPSDVQRFAQRTDEWQQDINKGIFYSFASLIATALVTHRYLRNKQPLAEKKRKPVATAGEDPYRFVE